MGESNPFIRLSYLDKRRGRLSIVFALSVAAPAVVFLNDPAEAGNCTVEKAVPWQWTLEQKGDKKTNPLTVYNDGGWGFERPGVREMLGNIIIGRTHDPKDGWCKRDDLPEKANVKISWIIDGTFTNNTFEKVPDIQLFKKFLEDSGKIELGEYETLVKVAADGLTFVPNNPPLVGVDNPNGISAGNIQASRPAITGLSLGTHPYTGSLNVVTRYGFGVANFNGIKDEPDISFIQVDPFLNFTAVLAEPEVVQIRYLYPEPVPAPLPLLGIGVALRATRRLRRMSRLL